MKQPTVPTAVQWVSPMRGERVALFHEAVPPWAGSFQHVPDVASSHWVEGERVGKTSLFHNCFGLEVTHSTSVPTSLLSWSHDPVGRKTWKSGVWASAWQRRRAVERGV